MKIDNTLVSCRRRVQRASGCRRHSASGIQMFWGRRVLIFGCLARLGYERETRSTPPGGGGFEAW